MAFVKQAFYPFRMKSSDCYNYVDVCSAGLKPLEYRLARDAKRPAVKVRTRLLPLQT